MKNSNTLLFAISLFFFSHPLIAQTEALIILPDGRVGIGTANPTEMFEVNGRLKAHVAALSNLITDSLSANNAKLNGLLSATSGHFSNDVNLEGSLTANEGLFSGNVTLNNAKVGEIGFGENWAGFSHKDVSDTKNGFGFMQNSEGTATRINIKSGNLATIGFSVDNISKMLITDEGRVGIGTYTPNAELEVIGSVNANFVNGIKPPVFLNIGTALGAENTQTLNYDLKDLCGDPNGCTMRVLLMNVDNNMVRITNEFLYFEQSNLSTVNTSGIHGAYNVLGGGWSQFTIDDGNTKADLIDAWGILQCRNYNLFGQLFAGYNVQFSVGENWIARVQIFD